MSKRGYFSVRFVMLLLVLVVGCQRSAMDTVNPVESKSNYSEPSDGSRENVSVLQLGPGSSGGGGGFVCRDDSGRILTAELLDLWEAPILYNWGVSESHLDVQDQISLSVEKLKSLNIFIGSKVEDLTVYMQNHMVAAPEGVEIAPPQDADPVFNKPNCKFEGFMRYDASMNRLWYKDEIWQKLSKTSRAALILHEAIYGLHRRDYYAKTSTVSRKLVGCLFSNSEHCGVENKTALDLLPKQEDVFFCTNDRISYYVYSTAVPKNKFKFHFIFTKLSYVDISKQVRSLESSDLDITNDSMSLAGFGIDTSFAKQFDMRDHYIRTGRIDIQSTPALKLDLFGWGDAQEDKVGLDEIHCILNKVTN